MKYSFLVDEQGQIFFRDGDAEMARPVVSAVEATQLLHRSLRHLYRLIRRGWLHPVARFAGQYFFDTRDVQVLSHRQAIRRTPTLPRRLSLLFPEYDWRSLHVDKDGDMILA